MTGKVYAMSSRFVVAALLAVLAACGTSTGSPTAQEILAKPPSNPDLRDAHFVVTGKITANGSTIDVSGDGAVVYRSAPQAGRFSFKAVVAGRPITKEDIYVNGIDYARGTPGDGKWIAQPTTAGLGPGSFVGASDFKYLGEEVLATGKAWHVRAKDKSGSPFEGWIRESDGFPLQYLQLASNSNATSTMTLTFDQFNTGATIKPPPASDVVQG